MNTFEIVIVGIIIILGLFFNRFLSRMTPEKSEAVRLILYALLLGAFCYSVISSSANGFRYLLLIALTFHFGYRTYKWIKGVSYQRNRVG